MYAYESLKLLSDNEIKKNNINILLAKQKGLIIEDDYTLYLSIQALYRKALDAYLLFKTSIKQYDELLQYSDLDFGLIPEERKCIYHIVSNMGLKYFYVRNFLYIEKLDDSDIFVLKNRILHKQTDIDDEILDIVKRTIGDVINDNFRKDSYTDTAVSCYGAAIPSNMVPSDALVISLHYGKNTVQLEHKLFLENLKCKNNFLMEMQVDIEHKLFLDLDLEVRVLIRNFIGEVEQNNISIL